jgi:lysine 6-dehydrogenase
MAQRYEGKIPTMEYKTLRYPGHAKAMETIRDLGLLGLEPVDVTGTQVVPRDLFISVVGPKLKKDYRTNPDLVALRVEAEGLKDGKETLLRWDLLDRYDEKSGITAMMRTTGFSLAVTGAMQAAGDIEPGVWTPDEAMSAPAYIDALAQRNVVITEHVLTPAGV